MSDRVAKIAGVLSPQNWHNTLYDALVDLISFNVPICIHKVPKVTSSSKVSNPGGRVPE